MEVEEAMEGTNPQQASVEYGDNGELELNFGGGLLEAEQEPEASPYSAPAAYEDSPPPRSRHAYQPSSSNRDAAAASKEHRPISFLEWQKKTKPDDEKEARVNDDTSRSSRHENKSLRQREPEGSRHQGSSRARSPENRRHRDPQPREIRGSPRHRALTPERRQPASRLRADERRVMLVPKFVDINHGIDRRPTLDRPARSARDRTRSPHIHRSTLHRADHPAAYERRRDPEVPRHAQHVPTRHATEPVWPELHAPPSGRKVEDFVRPNLDRAPLRTPDFAWDAAQYERTSHTVYPAPAEYDYRHGQSDYREPVGRDAGYRAPLYREAAYGDAGYAAAQGREVGYRPSSYDYEEPAYRDYNGSRSMDLPHSSYAHPDANWDAPRFPDPRHDAFSHGYTVSDDRWNDRDLRQLPARGSPRMPRADRGSPRLARVERDPVGLNRSGSYPYSRHDTRHDREHDFLPAREKPHHHAPRPAHEFAAPPSRSYRDGLHQGQRDSRAARPQAVSRHVGEYSSAAGHYGDTYASRRPPPPPSTNRRPSPRGKSPHRREPSPARDTRRQREPAQRSRHEDDRPSDRARHSSDRAEPAGREALKLISRSFAMEAAAANRPASAPEPAEPGQLDVADLPPPPARDASKAAPSQVAKPSRASVLVRPDPATYPRAEAPEGGDTSPVLNVQQGFLSEDTPTPTPADRPFQRCQRSHHPTGPTADQSRQSAAKADGSGKESVRRSSRDRAPDAREGKHAHKAGAAPEAKHDRDRSGANDLVEPSSKRKEASSRRQDNGSGRIADGKAVQDKSGEPETGLSSADKNERQKVKPSSGGKDAAKVGSGAATKSSPPSKAQDSLSKDRPASERKSDPKKAPRSPPKAKASATTDKGDKAAGSMTASRGDAIGEKQAGRKRRSRSRERSRSPKRKASSPATGKSGKVSERHRSTSERREQPLPPPPARPSSAANDADLPPPPTRLYGKPAVQQANVTALNMADQALPPPPPKPHSKNKESTSSRANGKLNGHDQLESKTLKPTQEGKPAGKLGADAAGKDASAKDASAKGASAKLAPAKGALAKASSMKPERESSAGRGSHKASEKVSEKSTDKGHLVARDTRRSGDRPPTGRSGQKRARSRSPPQKPLEGSKMVSSTKRQATASDGKQGDAKHSALQNGTSERSRDADKESRKEWMYEEKGKTQGPVSKKRLLEKWQKFKTEGKSKAADYLRFPVWRDGSRRAKQQVRDILTI